MGGGGETIGNEGLKFDPERRDGGWERYFAFFISPHHPSLFLIGGMSNPFILTSVLPVIISGKESSCVYLDP